MNQQMLLGANRAAQVWLINDNVEYVDATAAGVAGWTGTSTWGYATAPAPLQGSYSVRSTSVATAASSPTFAAQTTVYAYFMFNITTMTNDSSIWSFRDSSNNILAALTIRSTGAVQVHAGGATVTSGTGLVSFPGTYHCWCKYIAGSGANAVMQAYVSTTSTKPALTIQAVAGTSTASCNNFKVQGGSSTTALFDKIRVSASDIGSNPA